MKRDKDKENNYAGKQRKQIVRKEEEVEMVTKKERVTSGQRGVVKGGGREW